MENIISIGTPYCPRAAPAGSRMSTRRMTRGLMVSLVAMNAALYAIAAYATAYIESPWGMGQFRPAIVIPVTFATLFGPWVGAFGGALGTLLVDSIKHGQIYMPSLVAAVPGHLVSLLVYGWIIKKFTWPRFVLGCVVSLLAGNLVTAILYVWFVMGQPYLGLVVGLTAWWYVTMLPFAILLTPVLVRAATSSVRNLVRQDLGQASLAELKRPTFLALGGSGLALLVGGLISLVYPASIAELFAVGKFAAMKSSLTEVITWMSMATGAVLCLTAGAVALWAAKK